MPLKITPRTVGMAREDLQLEEMLQKVRSTPVGETVLFSEYGAYTVEGSQKAFSALSAEAVKSGVSIITTLNLSAGDLPHSTPGHSYNTLFVFSKNGKSYAPQAKITPQSFEMRQTDQKSPRMNVSPYYRLNKVRLSQNGEDFSGFFFICSDLYAFQLFDYSALKSAAIICTANFGNGAEDAAADLIEYSVQTRMFEQGFFSNSHQSARKGLVPLTKSVEKVFEATREPKPFDREKMDSIIKKSSVVYSDEEYHNFPDMLKLTQNGTFTVPRSRSIENGLIVKLGSYEKTIEL